MSRPIQVGDHIRWHNWAVPSDWFAIVLAVDYGTDKVVTNHGTWNISKGICSDGWILFPPARTIPNTQLKEGGNL